jgi:fermentation-respiration switch protein FrsA (DUF1100 family)
VPACHPDVPGCSRVTAGEAAAVITLLAGVPYLYAIVRGRVRPARVSWLIWTALGVVSFVSQQAAGATDSLWLTAGQVAVTGSIFVLSLFRGRPGWTRLDVYALVLATVGVLGWQLSTVPAIALASVIFADSMGVAVTVRKAAADPRSESATSFGMQMVGSCFGIAAVGAWDATLLAFPVYLALAQGLITAVIGVGHLRRRRAGALLPAGADRRSPGR